MAAQLQHSEWPDIGNIEGIEEDNAKAMLERADALLKAQDDGLKAMEARMSSLFGQSVTLASAAVAATVTAFAALSAPTGSANPPPWALPWVAQSVAVLSVVWLAAVAVAATSMLSQSWTAPGVQPRELYSEALLSAPPKAHRLMIARMLQGAIDENALSTARYSSRISWVVGLLAAGPVVTAAAGIFLGLPSWRPWLWATALLVAYLSYVLHLSKKDKATVSEAPE
jgi:hypothetical protein